MAFLPGTFPCSPRVGGAEVNLWLPATGCWGGKVKGHPAFINRAFLKFHKLKKIFKQEVTLDLSEKHAHSKSER